ncbi:hypothetical protein [Flexivirga meconopsidis]|uniref:hypothetical protein n=1 Tax=Flexivirga meconopsidis TaxID=2977121 RepID=UPI00223F50A3|nr:hypothetical protein [Flexivirga meconopsidis]
MRTRHALLAALATLPLAATGVATAPTAKAATTAKVLFDNGHAETAGNADWIISTSQPNPFSQDSAPTRETDWTGALSSWGVSLAQYRSTYTSLATTTRALTYGDSSNPQDLANFTEVVVPEPNTSFTAAERTALMKFVQNGGGLFLIIDHANSDRNNDGIDSVGVANQLFSANGVDNTNPFGITADVKNYSSEDETNIPAAAKSHPVINGPWGTVTGSILRGGTTFTIDKAANSSATCLLYRNAVSNIGTTGCFVAASTFGSGRIVTWGDSSPVDDGTGQSGNTLYDGWNDPAGTDAELALNATDWLAKLS